MIKKIAKLSLFILLILGISACNKQNPGKYYINNIEISAEEYAAIEASRDSFMNAPDHWKWPDSVKHVLLLPDSIFLSDSIRNDPDLDVTKYWTPEQKKFGRAISEVYLEYGKLEGTTIIVDISREEFMKKGIPEVYFDEMQQSIKDINFHNRLYKEPPLKIASLWAQMRNESRKWIKSGSEEE